MIVTGTVPEECTRVHNLLRSYGSNYVEETMTINALDITKPEDFKKLENLLEENAVKATREEILHL